MSRLYPTLEDMTVDRMAQAQMAGQPQPHAFQHHPQPQVQAPIYAPPQHGPVYPGVALAGPPVHPGGAPPQYPGQAAAFAPLYPRLDEYMGIAITPELVRTKMPTVVAVHHPQGMAVAGVTPAGAQVVAPLSGGAVGLKKAEVTHGIRHVQIGMVKAGGGKIGLRVRNINNGIFITFVERGSPGAVAGLRFGDQILQINGANMAGVDTDKAMKILVKCASDTAPISMAIKDRPFERTITMHRDSNGTAGFVFKDGEITSIVKDSSAARNGILTEHQLLEIEGQNVIGLKDKEVLNIIKASPACITITIMPSFLYKHMMKCISMSMVQKNMDHSIPEV